MQACGCLATDPVSQVPTHGMLNAILALDEAPPLFTWPRRSSGTASDGGGDGSGQSHDALQSVASAMMRSGATDLSTLTSAEVVAGTTNQVAALPQPNLVGLVMLRGWNVFADCTIYCLCDVRMMIRTPFRIPCETLQ